jgi:hypothetical protein
MTGAGYVQCRKGRAVYQDRPYRIGTIWQPAQPDTRPYRA